ncbi:MAG: hypothetical protein LBB50_04020 [Oscillospiraceae bacterium]|jgi:hypothetical protein|nr:hypothetical protein [Oscillospiraceae bacterium]
MSFKIPRHLNRFVQFYPAGSAKIPPQLAKLPQEPPDLRAFLLPLPAPKKAYTCFARGVGGVLWLGAPNGLVRYDPGAPGKEDRVWFFSAPQMLPHAEVTAILPAEDTEDESVWVQTGAGAAAKITLRALEAEEKADLLLDETLRVVDRRGMVSQRGLQAPRRLDLLLPYNESDNDGCFGCGFALGELFHYATLRRALGARHPKTLRAKAIAVRASEAMLLLMMIPGRGDGFVARTYLAPEEPIPDGWFFRKLGDGTAEVVDTPTAVAAGKAGLRVPAAVPVPARLARLHENEGIAGVGLVFKGDTSSDEITSHFAHLYYLHEILGPEDPELDALAVQAIKATMAHILDHGFELWDAFGAPTTWAKWSPRYFAFDAPGWVDAPLNAAELLMYLRVTMAVTGEGGRWQAAYDDLLARGYAELTTKHAERLEQYTLHEGIAPAAEIMYGDHWLATTAFWLLIQLEPDAARRTQFRAGYKSWRGSIGREHTPGYDFPYHLACPGEPIDWQRMELWFRRFAPSRLAAGLCVVGRHDVPRRPCSGAETPETGCLLPPDERCIAKLDRNPLALVDENDPNGEYLVESCYVYTFAYWLGRWHGLIEE